MAFVVVVVLTVDIGAFVAAFVTIKNNDNFRYLKKSVQVVVVVVIDDVNVSFIFVYIDVDVDAAAVVVVVVTIKNNEDNFRRINKTSQWLP